MNIPFLFLRHGQFSLAGERRLARQNPGPDKTPERVEALKKDMNPEELKEYAITKSNKIKSVALESSKDIQLLADRINVSLADSLKVPANKTELIKLAKEMGWISEADIAAAKVEMQASNERAVLKNSLERLLRTEPAIQEKLEEIRNGDNTKETVADLGVLFMGKMTPEEVKTFMQLQKQFKDTRGVLENLGIWPNKGTRPRPAVEDFSPKKAVPVVPDSPPVAKIEVAPVEDLNQTAKQFSELWGRLRDKMSEHFTRAEASGKFVNMYEGRRVNAIDQWNRFVADREVKSIIAELKAKERILSRTITFADGGSGNIVTEGSVDAAITSLGRLDDRSQRFYDTFRNGIPERVLKTSTPNSFTLSNATPMGRERLKNTRSNAAPNSREIAPTVTPASPQPTLSVRPATPTESVRVSPASISVPQESNVTPVPDLTRVRPAEKPLPNVSQEYVRSEAKRIVQIGKEVDSRLALKTFQITEPTGLVRLKLPISNDPDTSGQTIEFDSRKENAVTVVGRPDLNYMEVLYKAGVDPGIQQYARGKVYGTGNQNYNFRFTRPGNYEISIHDAMDVHRGTQVIEAKVDSAKEDKKVAEASTKGADQWVDLSQNGVKGTKYFLDTKTNPSDPTLYALNKDGYYSRLDPSEKQWYWMKEVPDLIVGKAKNLERTNKSDVKESQEARLKALFKALDAQKELISLNKDLPDLAKIIKNYQTHKNKEDHQKILQVIDGIDREEKSLKAIGVEFGLGPEFATNLYSTPSLAGRYLKNLTISDKDWEKKIQDIGFPTDRASVLGRARELLKTLE